MTSPTEILETIVLHVDAGGSLLRTSPIIAMASVDETSPDPASQALAAILRDMRGDSPYRLTADSPLVTRAKIALAGGTVEAMRAVVDEASALPPGWDDALIGSSGGPSLDAPIELPADAAAMTYDPNGVYEVTRVGDGSGGSVLAAGADLVQRIVLVNQAPQPIRSILDVPHGLHEGVSKEIYHQRVVGLVSKSVLDLVDHTPATLKAWLDGYDSEETRALFLGSATHCAVLEPERYGDEYAVEPVWGDLRATDATTKEDAKANKTRRDEWRAEYGGKILLSADDADMIAGMAASLRRHPKASRMLVHGIAESTIRWRDPVTGLECKCRPDYYRRDIKLCVDLKTTEDASPLGFARSVAKYRYHVQGPHYAAGFEAINEPIERERFVFVVVEKAPPHLVACYRLSEDAWLRGRMALARNMGRLADCIENDTWPGYSEEIEEIDLPGWAP